METLCHCYYTRLFGPDRAGRGIPPLELKPNVVKYTPLINSTLCSDTLPLPLPLGQGSLVYNCELIPEAFRSIPSIPE